MMTDIVAYTYSAEELCPNCTVTKLGGTPTDIRVAGSVEALLDRTATTLGIDREDERSFDSGDFPKVVFADQIDEDHNRCDSCGKELI